MQFKWIGKNVSSMDDVFRRSVLSDGICLIIDHVILLQKRSLRNEISIYCGESRMFKYGKIQKEAQQWEQHIILMRM